MDGGVTWCTYQRGGIGVGIGTVTYWGYSVGIVFVVVVVVAHSLVVSSGTMPDR